MKIWPILGWRLKKYDIEVVRIQKFQVKISEDSRFRINRFTVYAKNRRSAWSRSELYRIRREAHTD